MKTAEEILKRYFCSKCEGNLVMSINDIEAIQLDAFKAGAEWAAKIVWDAKVPQKDAADYWHNIALQFANREINVELVKMKELPK